MCRASRTTDGDSGIYVHASVIAGGKNLSASVHLDGEATDEDVAEALAKASLAAAQMHSSGVWMALQRRWSNDRDETSN